MNMLKYVSPCRFINTQVGFLLEDIMYWCVNYPRHALADNLLMYVKDNNLDTPENMKRVFVINSTPFEEFKKHGIAEEYTKYCGYSLQCIDEKGD